MEKNKIIRITILYTKTKKLKTRRWLKKTFKLTSEYEVKDEQNIVKWVKAHLPDAKIWFPYCKTATRRFVTYEP